jgi:vancomycin resistance protein YoaR
VADVTPTTTAAPGSSSQPQASSRWLRWAVIGGGVLIAVPVVLYGVAAATSGGDVPRGTTVEGVAIGGLTAQEAQDLLERELAPRLNEPVVVVAGPFNAKVVPAKSGVAFDAEATVADAGGVGRTPTALIGGLFGADRDVAAVLVVDQERVDAVATRAAARLTRDVRDGAIVFEGASYRAIEPSAGQSVEVAPVAAAFTEGAVAADRRVDIDAEALPPAVDEAALDKAVASIARPAVSGPITVRVSGGGGGVDEAVVVPVARFTEHLQVEADEGELVLTVDPAGLREEIAPELEGVEVPATDATFRISGGRPVVVPSREGRALSVDELGDEFAVAVVDDGARVAEVRLTRAEPELTTAEARELGVVERVSSFTQGFPFAPYRFQNIGQAAERVNGTLLLPGDTFSMNDTALERTPENGYTTGFVIRDGRLTEDLGGGVSTITTAVWDAAFFAGLERVEQRAHSFFISRYKPGLEATVSWGSLDLKFRNNTPNGVFITAERGRTFITVSMWSTKTVDVRAEFGPRTNVKPFTRAVDTGPNCTPQSGVQGFTIVVTRVISRDGEEIKREPLKTVYRPATNVVCRVAAPPPRATPSPSPTTSPKPSPSPKPTG